MTKIKQKGEIKSPSLEIGKILTNICLDNFLGNKKTKEEIFEIYHNFINKDILKSFKINPDKSFLFYGPPGNGKTFGIKCLSGELGKNNEKYALFPYDIGKYGSAYINIGAVNMNTFFEAGKKLSQEGSFDGFIYLFDECDIIMGRRESFNSHKEDNKILETLMKHLQRIHDEDTNEYIFFTTNIKEEIDPASIRSGRLDRVVKFGNPNEEARFELFEKEIKRINENAEYNIIRNYNLNHLVEISKGFNCCDCIEIPKRALKNTLIKFMKDKKKISLVHVTNKTLIEEIKKQQERNDKIKKIGFKV